MVDPIQGIIDKLVVRNPSLKSTLKTGSPGKSAPDPAEADAVDFNSDLLIDAVRTQAGVLRNELPSIISEALLAPVADQAARNQPLNSLLFRLQNPLEGVLGKLPQEELSDELIRKLQDELNQFKIGLPALKDEAILAQFSNDPAQANPLNEIVASLSTQVDDLALSLQGLL